MRMSFQQIEKLLNSVFFKYASIQVLNKLILEYFVIFIQKIIKSLYFPLRIFALGNIVAIIYFNTFIL